jgi:prolactin regulatory element-binding protein
VPSKVALTAAEKASEGKGKMKASESELEIGRWDVLVRREVAGKPVTVFDVRSVYCAHAVWEMLKY